MGVGRIRINGCIISISAKKIKRNDGDVPIFVCRTSDKPLVSILCLAGDCNVISRFGLKITAVFPVDSDVLYELESSKVVSEIESDVDGILTDIYYEEGDEVDKIKVTGIELKKAQVPKEMKQFLNDIYSGVVNDCWEEKDYENYVNDLYNKFSKFNINEISFWKGYSTARESIGFLQMAVGTTGIAKSCEFFN